MKALKLDDLKKMSKADLTQLLTLILELMNTLQSGNRFDYKIGDIVIAGKSLDYGVYVEGSAAVAAKPGAFAEKPSVEKPLSDKEAWKKVK